jgi:hypothetical protein
VPSLNRGFSAPIKLFIWQATTGLTLGGRVVEGTRDPLAALDRVMAIEENALFLFKDLHKEMEINPLLVRKLRDAYDSLGASYKTVFITAPVLTIPFELSKEMSVVDFDLPAPEELSALFAQVLESFAKSKGMNKPPTPEGPLRPGGHRLTIDEAKNASPRPCLEGRCLTLRPWMRCSRKSSS